MMHYHGKVPSFIRINEDCQVPIVLFMSRFVHTGGRRNFRHDPKVVCGRV